MASNAKSRIKSVSYAKYGYIFILPFFLVYAFFQVWPLINTIILSFQGNGSATGSFAGVSNYATLLFGGDGSRGATNIHLQFGHALLNTVILWVGNFIPQIILSLLLAVWFTDAKLHIPGKGFFKVVMYLPNIITAVSVSALFLCLISNQQTSAANTMLTNMGKSSYNFEGIVGTFGLFDGTAGWSRAIVMFIQTWMWFGNTMIMMMSGILGINPALFEAASIDGATSGQTLFKVTLPLLRPMVVYTLITSMIGGLQMFDIPYLFHSSTNGSINEHLRTVAVFIYENFHVSNQSNIQYGYSGAASVILFVITAILGMLVFRMNRDEDEVRKKKERKEMIKAAKAQAKLEKDGGLF